MKVVRGCLNMMSTAQDHRERRVSCQRLLRAWVAALVASPLLVAGLLATGVAQQPSQTGVPAQAAEKSSSNDQAAPAKKESAGEAKASEPKLSPAQTQLRDGLRRVLAFYLANHTFNTRDNTPNDVLQLCLAYGADAQLGYDGASGAKVNALGSLCWNTPCAGYSLLQMGDGRVMARVGYGLQDCPAQFLAVLAQSRVPTDYEIRVGQQRKTVADLVESEKVSCREGGDLSMKLLALSHYLPGDAGWNNASGEAWSLERLLEWEVDRKAAQDGEETTNRLMGLSYALDRRARRGLPLDGQYGRAQKHVADYQEFALRIANPDGSWHPRFFAARGASTDAAGVLRATGHVLEWLVFSLPEDRVQEPSVTKSISFATGTLENWQQSANTAAISPRLRGAIMHAAHALLLYDQRVFRPYDPKTPAAEKGDAKTQGSTTSPAKTDTSKRLSSRSSSR